MYLTYINLSALHPSGLSSKLAADVKPVYLPPIFLYVWVRFNNYSPIYLGPKQWKLKIT